MAGQPPREHADRHVHPEDPVPGDALDDGAPDDGPGRDGEAATAQELDQLCIEHIARFKRPKRYLQAAELPKNAAGKILKAQLREQLAASGRAG